MDWREFKVCINQNKQPMTAKIALVLICLGLAGLANGICDSLIFHYPKTGFEKGDNFWDPYASWVNKYKNGDVNQGPKFPGSTTVFVWLTDAWHLFKMLQLFCIKMAVLFAASMAVKRPLWYWAFAFAALTSFMGLGFKIFYSWIWA